MVHIDHYDYFYKLLLLWVRGSMIINRDREYTDAADQIPICLFYFAVCLSLKHESPGDSKHRTY